LRLVRRNERATKQKKRARERGGRGREGGREDDDDEGEGDLSGVHFATVLASLPINFNGQAERVHDDARSDARGGH